MQDTRNTLWSIMMNLDAIGSPIKHKWMIDIGTHKITKEWDKWEPTKKIQDTKE